MGMPALQAWPASASHCTLLNGRIQDQLNDENRAWITIDPLFPANPVRARFSFPARVLPWDGAGIEVAVGKSYTFPIEEWTSGTAHAWGPCRGLLIKFQKSDASAEALQIKAVYAQ